jgi:hypothetical protein
MKGLARWIGAMFVMALGLTGMSAPAAAAYSFSSPGLDDVLYWAGQKKPAELTTNEFAAVILAVTWPEAAGGSQNTPSPMTMGRWDLWQNLFAFGNNQDTNPYKRAFFHAGVGAWQLDAGYLGTNVGIQGMIYTYTASRIAAEKMAALWPSSGTKEYKRSVAWQPWVACGKDYNGNGIKDCEDVFRAIYNPSTDSLNVTRDSGVSRLGGATWKTCNYVGYTNTFSCLEVDPAQAQGHKGSWYYQLEGNYSGGLATRPTPVSRTLYNYLVTGGEHRAWLKRDPSDPYARVYDKNILASRSYGSDPRTSLTWVSFMGLCVNGDCSKSQ